MKIAWTEQDLQKFATTYGREMGGGATQKEALAAVGSEAAELLAARGGTMTAEQVAVLRAQATQENTKHWSAQSPFPASDVLALLDSLSAQGARIAALEQALRESHAGATGTHQMRIEALEQHVSELEKSLENVRNDLAEVRNHWNACDKERGEAVSARDAAQEELGRTISYLETVRKERDEALARVERLATSQRMGAEREMAWRAATCCMDPGAAKLKLDAADTSPVFEHMHATQGSVQRYPCSPTCTHDDAANPGHPERVKRLSDAWEKMHSTGYSERVKRRGETAVERPDLEALAWDAGAEAMRAACLEAVQREGQKFGLSTVALAQFKAAIEGAAP